MGGVRFILEIGECPVTPIPVMQEEKYAEALDALVVACVDIVLVHKGLILLGERSRHPHPDWWILGGRMFRGEYFEDTAQRILAAEGGITVKDKDRFRKIGVANFLWNERAQWPAGNGSQQISITTLLLLKEEEIELLTHNDEYNQFSWVSTETIKKGDFHQYVKECAEVVEYFSLEK